ncbi:MAG: SRPBCC domain-containing protein [Pseudomonadota bacterium]
MTDLPEYVLERQFDAPREMVWRAWTDPRLLARWYGPNVETVIHEFDLRPGGVWLNEMKWDGGSSCSRADFTEIETGARLVWHHASTDRQWNVASNPMMPDWPRLLLTRVIFTEASGGTLVRLSQTPMEATEAEIACFAKMMAGMDKGWGSGFAILADILAEMQSNST